MLCCGLSCSGSRPVRPYTAQAGSAELEALLAAAAAAAAGGQQQQQQYTVSLEQLQCLFPFKLDGFQEKAVQQLLEGKSVVVCAPTGERADAVMRSMGIVSDSFPFQRLRCRTAVVYLQCQQQQGGGGRPMLVLTMDGRSGALTVPGGPSLAQPMYIMI